MRSLYERDKGRRKRNHMIRSLDEGEKGRREKNERKMETEDKEMKEEDEDYCMLFSYGTSAQSSSDESLFSLEFQSKSSPRRRCRTVVVGGVVVLTRVQGRRDNHSRCGSGVLQRCKQHFTSAPPLKCLDSREVMLAASGHVFVALPIAGLQDACCTYDAPYPWPPL